MKFKIGDSVVVAHEALNALGISFGVIKGIHPFDNGLYAVELKDGKYVGHVCGGFVPSGLGMWIKGKNLDFAKEDETIPALEDILKVGDTDE